MKSKNDNTSQLHLWISGVVQGVWFRENIRRRALELGLTGWVRNLPDGRVEVLLEGEANAVREMAGWCREDPPLAHVDSVVVEEEKGEKNGNAPRQRFESFEIIR